MKTLRRLTNGKAETLVEIPDTIRGISAADSVVYLSDPTNGTIYQFKDGGLSLLCDGLEGVHGIHAFPDMLYCESSDLHFFTLRLFDLMISTLVGVRGKEEIRSTKHDPSITHPRINGLNFHPQSRSVFFAMPERHSVYQLKYDSSIIRFVGNGKPGFSIGSKECSCSSPSGVTTCDNFLFVADTGNHVIREFIINGTGGGRMIGSPMATGRVDDIAFRAKLSSPTDICCNNHILYFIDDYNSIRTALSKTLIVNTLYIGSNRIESLSVNHDGTVFFTETV